MSHSSTSGRTLLAGSYSSSPPGDAVGGGHAGHLRLDAEGPVSLGQPGGRVGEGRLDGVTGAVRVGGDEVAGPAAEQPVDGHPEGLRVEIPQGLVDGGDRRHRDGSAAPVGAPVAVLPDVVDAARIGPDEGRGHVVGDIGRDGQFAAVQRTVAVADEAVVRGDAHRAEGATRRAHQDVDGLDPHGSPRETIGSPNGKHSALGPVRRDGRTHLLIGRARVGRGLGVTRDGAWWWPGRAEPGRPARRRQHSRTVWPGRARPGLGPAAHGAEFPVRTSTCAVGVTKGL